MLSELLERVARGLQSRSIPYMVIGGQAVLVYGEPRMTRDIDVMLGVGPEHLGQIEEFVSSLDLKILRPSHAEFVRDRMVLPCGDPESGFRVDFIFSFTPSSGRQSSTPAPSGLGRRTSTLRLQKISSFTRWWPDVPATRRTSEESC